MPELKLSSAVASDLTNKVSDIAVPVKQIEGALDQDETIFINTKWTQQFGYFSSIPELKSAIVMKAIWNVGKGYSANPETMVILDHVSGWGKDTFDDILFNMEIIRRIGGDAYAEIIRADDKSILNLKPLNPEYMKIVVDRKGRIIRYEQISKIKGNTSQTFKPEDILHLSNNRLADQIHGISDIDALESTILADNENFIDMRKIMHRQARPMIMFKLGTDVPSTINSFIDKMDKAVNKGENIYIPDDKDSVNFEVIQVDVAANVLAWRNDLKNRFYRAIGLPQVIFGQANATESGGKIEYLAHEQVFERDQRFLEKQIWNQLGLKINLLPPTSLLNAMQTDQKKDGSAQQMNIQPSDMMAGQGA